MTRYACPFCFRTKPRGYEPSVWSCCGEIGHAIVFAECPSCGAEDLTGSDKCLVCGHQELEPA
jgi:hypothetical protein